MKTKVRLEGAAIEVHHPVCDDCGKWFERSQVNERGDTIGTAYQSVTNIAPVVPQPGTGVMKQLDSIHMTLCAACYLKDRKKNYPTEVPVDLPPAKYIT